MLPEFKRIAVQTYSSLNEALTLKSERVIALSDVTAFVC